MKSKHVSYAALAAMSLALGVGVTAANADTFTVYVGYADNLRASGFFPNPWVGDPGIVSQSGTTGWVYDAGAIRIANTGATALDVTNVTVTMNGGSGPTYSIWSPLVVGVGQQGIFTQTDPTAEDFDSSDNSPNGTPIGSPPILASDPGSNGIGGCSSTAAAKAAAGITGTCASEQPIVKITENGNTFTLNDTGHILDTGWYDFVNNNVDGNESINWNVIGSEASRGGTVPEPSTWAMMMLGFAGLGFAAYRTKRGAKAAVAA
jgi:PEP-CTERM motif